MRRTLATLFVLTIPSLLASACEESKSATPLSPSIAGPIAGVEISEPGAVSPNSDARIASDQQPIKLVVNNASSNGVRPLSYRFEVATQADFSNPAFTQNGVKPGDGQTSFLLPQSLDPGRAEQVYYWRAKAYDGANDGDFTPPVKFTVFRPVTIGRSNAISPPNNSTTTTTKPVLEVQNAPVTGPAAEIHVLFEVATDGAMANRIISAEVAAGGNGRTAYGIQSDLLPATRYFWRVRTFDLAGHTGDYSDIFSFVTPAAPSGGGGDTGGGGGGGPISSPNDQIDVKSIVIEWGADIRSWVVDSTITSVTRNGTTFCTNHTKAGKWPVLPFFDDPSVTIEGNQWFFAKIGGVWYGGANEWMRPGQTCKDVGGFIGENYGNAPHLSHWSPSSGEVVGVAVSTPARAGQQGTAERSNIVLFTWP